MDCLFPTAANVPAANTAEFFGILYAEDFDDPADLNNDNDQSSAPPPLPSITQADVDAACAAAVRAARLDWQASQDQARLNAIAALSAVLVGIRETAERATLAATEGTVTAILSIVHGLLPQFSREHGPAEIRALLERLLPTIRSYERINVRVHPDLVTLVQRDLATLDDGLADLVDVLAAPLDHGDVKVAWENGTLVRDTKQMIQAVGDALSALGLHQPIKAPAERRMAYAD